MNMITTIAAPAVAVAAPSIASAMPSGSFQIIELLAPPQNFELWGALAMDGGGQRWIVSAKHDGEITLAVWEDRAHPGRNGGWIPDEAPPELKSAIREALLDCPIALTRAAILPRPDPVFAAIEQHKAAWAEYNAALDAFTAAEEKLPRQYLFRPWAPVPEIRDHDDRLIVAIVENDAKRYDVMTAEQIFPQIKRLAFFRAHTPKEINGFLTGEGCDEARKVAKRTLASAQRRRQRARNKVGYYDARRRKDESCHAEIESLDALALTIPTTAAGARALMKYWIGYHMGLATADEEHLQTLRLLTSLWSGVGTIASMAREEPPAVV